MRTRLSIRGKSLDNNYQDTLHGFLLCLHIYDALKRCAALHNCSIRIIVF